MPESIYNTPEGEADAMQAGESHANPPRRPDRSVSDSLPPPGLGLKIAARMARERLERLDEEEGARREEAPDREGQRGSRRKVTIRGTSVRLTPGNNTGGLFVPPLRLIAASA